MTDLYDPELRRDTPLALKLKERIRRDGPITVAEYMQACLQDPEHGYYVRQQAIGARGDFITAPEISQVFGELIGLWCAVVWQQMGSPARVNLVELGPGRGTLMRDALRAAKVLPGFLAAAEVHLIESNEALAEQQREQLSEQSVPIFWHGSEFEPTPEGHTIYIANEFLDALPIEQWRYVPELTRNQYSGTGTEHHGPYQPNHWQQRFVGLDEQGRLEFLWADPNPYLAQRYAPWHVKAEGQVIETRKVFDGWDPIFCWRFPAIGREPLRDWDKYTHAALVIDYGQTQSSPGDTFQAVRGHVAEHPLTSPGEADLTAHVDFAEFARLAAHTRTEGEMCFDGPVTQAEFLASLGILQRAARLMSANPSRAHEIEAGVARIMAVPGMGDRFKAIGIRSPGLPPLPGFPLPAGSG